MNNSLEQQHQQWMQVTGTALSERHCSNGYTGDAAHNRYESQPWAAAVEEPVTEKERNRDEAR
ncbi:hypothetical protein [Marinobacterium arenosum]|uniref:hypothetical protein n=1 Tax=Marinobacterium arenosum TaxID=2862496 RepID=UPI001C96C580|nr:hypothetical protein [Marinobacterium arenosum]MBY4677146.1 hypothetical protein [Marinobacterium arenosum]